MCEERLEVQPLPELLQGDAIVSARGALLSSFSLAALAYGTLGDR